MKIPRSPLLRLPLLLALLPWAAFAQTSARPPEAGAMAGGMERMPPDAPPLEKVTFLGVETRPVDSALAAQLGLPDDFGLVVTTVVPDSPAAGQLAAYDVLLKFQDQRLVDSRQLAALVRAQKPGDAVKLTVMRKGREQVLEVKLGEHALPRVLAHFRAFGAPPLGMAGAWTEPEGFAARVPDKFLALLPHDRDPASTRIILRHEGAAPGAAMLDVGHSTIVYSDDQGTLELTMDAGKRQLVAKDKDGKVLFSGPIDTEAELRAVPESVRPRLKLIETPRDLGAGPMPEMIRVPGKPGAESLMGPVTRQIQGGGGAMPSAPI